MAQINPKQLDIYLRRLRMTCLIHNYLKNLEGPYKVDMQIIDTRIKTS